MWEQLTVGVEVEFPGVYDRTYGSAPVPIRWDGSIVTKLNDMFLQTNTDIGTEFASYPRSTISGIDGDIRAIYAYAASRGGIVNERGSFHVHVYIPRSLRRVRVIKHLLKHFYYNDIHLLRLGGLGGANRGFANDFSYERPLSSPPVVYHRVSGNYIYVFHVEDVIKSKFRNMDSLLDFMFDEYTRYNAGRYTTVNFHSLRLYGTIEFRTFNVPASPDIAVDLVTFCRMYIFALLKNYLENRVDVEKEMDFDKIISFIGLFVREKSISNALYRLHDLYLRSEEINRDVLSIPTIYHRIIQGFSTNIYYHRRDRKIRLVKDPKRPRLTDYREYSADVAIKIV